MKKKHDEWILLLDAAMMAFLVHDSTFAFSPVDAHLRLPVEGLEEDGKQRTPATIARKWLVHALRAQAFAMVNAPREAITAAQKASANEPDEFKKWDAAVAAIVAVIGERLPSPMVMPPLNPSWIAEFNRLAVTNIPTTELVAMIDKSTIDAVSKAKTVTEFLNNGAFSPGRATTIIRTETAKATMAKKLDEMADKKKEWVTTPGACVFCRQLDGVVLPLGDDFQNKATFGPVKHPPAHPNCRCTIVEAL